MKNDMNNSLVIILMECVSCDIREQVNFAVKRGKNKNKKITWW